MSSDSNIWKTGVNDNGNGTDNNQYFISDTSDGEIRLTIQRGTGNIGVGTNEPSQLLDVSGNINLSGNIYLSNTGTIYKNGQEYGGGSGGSGGTSTLWTENSTKIYYNDGNVGINTNDPKERLEVFARGGVLKLDNYQKLTGFGWPGFDKMNLWQQDKGQKACAKAFIDAISEGDKSPIPIDEIFEVSKISIKLANQ